MSEKEPEDVRAIMLDGSAIQRAQRESWIKTMDRHKRLGNPIVVWRDGKVVWIPAEEIEIPVGGTDSQDQSSNGVQGSDGA